MKINKIIFKAFPNCKPKAGGNFTVNEYSSDCPCFTGVNNSM